MTSHDVTGAAAVTGPTASDRRAWEDSGPEEVGNGVFRIPLPLPGDSLRAVNVYAFLGAERVDLVDAGWAIPAAEAALDRGLTSFGMSSAAVRNIYVTHMHRDHYTLAVRLRQTHGAKVYVGAGEQAGLASVAEHHDDLLPAPFVQRMRTHGAAALLDTIATSSVDVMEPIDSEVWEQPDAWLHDGDLLPAGRGSLRVISTPGHTSGHSVLQLADRSMLCTGDHVLPHITPSVGFEAGAGDSSPLTNYLASLRRLLSEPDAVMLPAHGPVRPSTHDRVREILAHHDDRLQRTADALRSGTSTAMDVAAALRWTRREVELAALPPFEQVLAVNETAAHLEHLVVEGGFGRSTDQGHIVYARV